MKVLHVVAGGSRGGAETYCLDAIQALHALGVNQSVVCRAHPHYLEVLERLGIRHKVLDFNLWERLSGAGSAVIRRAIGEHSPDIVHAWMGRASSFMPADVQVPVLGWFGGYYDLKRFRHCDAFVGVTRDIRRRLIEESGCEDRCFVVHTFGTLQPQAAVSRAALQTPEGVPVVLLLSRMHRKKGVDTLLRAALALPDAYFWLAGDGPELRAYRRLADRLQLAQRVRFLGWRTDRAALLNAADICVLPSRYEPFGTVMAESWYAGVPLVATRAAGAAQYVSDGVDGLLCEIDDAAGLARQLRRVIDDRELRQMLVENGRRTYAAQFSREVATETLLETYRKCVGMGKRFGSLKAA